MPPLLVPAPPPGPRGRPLHAGGTGWRPDRGQRRAAAERVSHRKPRLTQAGGAGPRRLEQLTTTLLNRETMSGSRKQHS
jgi:hypothetical protein